MVACEPQRRLLTWGNGPPPETIRPRPSTSTLTAGAALHGEERGGVRRSGRPSLIEGLQSPPLHSPRSCHIISCMVLTIPLLTRRERGGSLSNVFLPDNFFWRHARHCHYYYSTTNQPPNLKKNQSVTTLDDQC